MVIGGFQKVSLIDYPGKISSIIFTQGCNFRCGYCHNPELSVPGFFSVPILEQKILSFLQKRQGKIEAVVITGGEPTVQPDLLEFIRKIKKLGFLVKLDTNGSKPALLKKVINLKNVDYLAMDIKAPLQKYQQIVNSKVDPEKIAQSIKLIMNSGIAYEFRTTLVRSQLDNNDLLRIGELIKGAKLYALQKFIPTKTSDPHFLQETSYSDEELDVFKKIMENYVERCIIR